MSSALEDKEAIRELVARYCHTIDAGRTEEWVACFTEDGVFDSPILGRWEGRAKLREFTKHYAEWTGDATARHNVSNLLIELDGERARVECYLLMTHATAGETHVVVSGTYEHRLAKVDGAWRFREVHVRPDTQLES